MELEEEYEPETQEAVTSFQSGVVGSNIIVGVIGGLLGGSIIQALYMLFNLQQLLILFLFMKFDIHSDVRFFIKKQSFVLMNFEFIEFVVPSFIVDLKFIENTHFPQPTKAMREIEKISRSTLKTNINLILIYLIIILVHFILTVVIFLKSFCPKSTEEIDKDINIPDQLNSSNPIEEIEEQRKEKGN